MMPISLAEDTTHYLRINELKNYVYCPRISYYALCLGLDRETGLSRSGIDAEANVKARMKRRKHALHTVVDGTRHLDVLVASHIQHLVGRLDEVVETPSGVHLVDYKDTERDYGYWKLQMCAYQLCVEESWRLPILGCHVYSIPTQQYHPVTFNKRERNKLLRIVKDIAAMIQEERCPPPTNQRGKCHVCQYARFCNDIF